MSCTLRRHTNQLRSFLVILGLVCMTGILAPLSAGAVEDAPGSTVFSIPVPNYFKENASSSGDVVVWDRSQYDSGISGYDLSEKKSFNVPIPAGGIARRPRVCGDWVLFEVFFKKNSARNIFAYDRSDGSVTAVTNGKGQRSAVEVDGDIAVWEAYEPDPADYRSEDTNIYGKNLSTGETFTVTPVSGEHHSPDVAGDWVVYSDWKGGRGKSVRAFNITTKTTKTLCDWAGDQYYPRISSSGFVVWQNVRDPKHVNETTDLYGCSVNGGPIRKIAGLGVPGQSDDWRQRHRLPGRQASWGVPPSGVRPAQQHALRHLKAWQRRLLRRWDTRRHHRSALYQAGSVSTSHLGPAHRPTQLEVIADDPAIDEALDVGDDDLIADATPASLPSGFASLPAAASVSTVVVSAANDWPSTVIASSLAGRRSPLLLTWRESVPGTVLAKLAKLAPAHVVVVGGPSSVSTTAFAQLQSVVGTAAVTRVPGADDESRSLAVASIVESRPGWNGTVLVVSRGSASAALMAVPASVRKGLPLVLADSKGLSGPRSPASSPRERSVSWSWALVCRRAPSLGSGFRWARRG